jgi:hypothetical protein
MNLSRLSNISSKEYQEWFECHYPFVHGRSPFHNPAWLETVARVLKFKAIYIAAYDNEELVSVIPGFLYRRGLLRLFGSPMRGTMTSYLGPVSIRPIQGDQARIDLLTTCSSFVRKEWHAAYSRFTLRDEPVELPKLGKNCSDQTPGSYRLDLSKGVDGLWKGLESDCRRNIRRARDAGMEIVPLEDAGLFYRMIDETFRRHGSTSFHKENFFHALLSELVPRDLLWPWGVKYKGEIIAGALFLHDDREVHFISGASFPNYGSLPTSYLLHWNAIEVATKMGLRIFNSERSRIPTIDKFKESFRPILEERYTLICAPSYLRSTQKIFIRAYSRLRKFNSQFKRANKQSLPSK